jgi:alkylation response protein AidB-like acyl-CoA dehydrogenase
MNLTWSAEQLALRDNVEGFAHEVLTPSLAACDDSQPFTRALWQRCADYGIVGLPIPEAFGGSGQDVMTTMLAMEALGRGCSHHGLLFSLHAHMWAVQLPILAFGTDEQKRRFLPRLVDGSWIGAHGMSEPESGTDAFSMRTRAERRGDMYVLEGSKTFVTNAPVADVFVVFATVNPARGMWGVTGFVVERDAPGLAVGSPLHKMGLTGSPMAEVFFDGCEIPVQNRLGREGQGHTIFNHSMAWERSCILASMVGGMERELAVCVDYAKTRRQFGKPIGNFQLVSAKLADMKVRLETARMLLYRAAWAHATDGNTALEGAMAKLYISEAAVQSAMDAIQIHGGYGYMREYGVERGLRDAIGARLYSGTSEIQRLIIARHLGLSPA